MTAPDLGPLPNAGMLICWRAGEQVCTMEQLEDERQRCYALGVERERERWVAIACDGWAVLGHIDKAAASRTGHIQVSDTLDALVRCIRAMAASTDAKG
jgi:hypothetical protein